MMVVYFLEENWVCGYMFGLDGMFMGVGRF